MSRHSIDAHALGVAAPDENAMGSLLVLDRERLIKRHQEQVARIYAGITQRASEHQAETSALAKRVSELRAQRQALGVRVNYLMLVLLFCVGTVLYFAVRDAACPVVPWISKIVQ